MTAPDLLPCPLPKCGGRAEYVPAFGVKCTACGLALPCTEAEAAVAWNTRATPAAMTPEVRALDSFDALIADARAEAEKAMQKFPQPNYVISKVAEEAGEVVKAAIHAAEGRETMQNLRGEMRQTIAMLYRLWVEGDQVHGLPPVDAALRAGGQQ